MRGETRRDETYGISQFTCVCYVRFECPLVRCDCSSFRQNAFSGVICSAHVAHALSKMESCKCKVLNRENNSKRPLFYWHFYTQFCISTVNNTGYSNSVTQVASISYKVFFIEIKRFETLHFWECATQTLIPCDAIFRSVYCCLPIHHVNENAKLQGAGLINANLEFSTGVESSVSSVGLHSNRVVTLFEKGLWMGAICVTHSMGINCRSDK